MHNVTAIMYPKFYKKLNVCNGRILYIFFIKVYSI